MKFRLLVILAIMGLFLAGGVVAWSAQRRMAGSEATLAGRLRREAQWLVESGPTVWSDVELACALLHFADVFRKPEWRPADRSFFYNTTTCQLWEEARLAQKAIQEWLGPLVAAPPGSAGPPGVTWEPSSSVEGSRPPTAEESENWLHRWLTPQWPVEGNQP
ncbi:MAG: hypothetical protein AB1791_16210 [Chloroflexota bacterium]